MKPLSLPDLIRATRAEARGPALPPRIERISIDSRTVCPGDLFWALRGKRHDGHAFVRDAQARGACACLVERSKAAELSGSSSGPLAGSFTGPLLVVEDSLLALHSLARMHREKQESLVIGVTGSVGKTTTREMLYSLLSASHTGMRSLRNFNNEVGLPLSLLDLSADHEFGVFELGAGRRGDIRKLCDTLLPEVGVITRIGPAHLESFGSLEEIYRTKVELLEALPPHGFAVIGGDDDRLKELATLAACNVISVGEGSGNTLCAGEVNFEPGRLSFSVDGARYVVPAPARHYLHAALSALAVAREIGMDARAIAEGFSHFAGEPGRCRVERVGSWTVIDDTYNASPLSMQAACLCLRDWPSQGNRLLVVGDMLELGNESERSHRELGACASAVRVDRLLAFGAHADSVARGALDSGMSRHQIAECHDFESLLTVLDCWLAPEDVVLVKGSRGMNMERVVDWLKQQEETPGRGRAGGVRVRAVA
jgi:UDP-N-acetylmuramoyl-tripeptide--D-alanyl-D-alanine ligase